MRKTFATILALLMLLSPLLLSQPAAAEELKDWVEYEVQASEMEEFNIFHTHSARDFNILTNLQDALLTHDSYGRLLPNLAESWETEDNGKTWTFHLRDGIEWFNKQGESMAPIVAQDFVWGMEWVLNFHKNDSKNTSMPIDMIEGAGEYYEYTKSLSPEEGLALGLEKFEEMVGVAAPDEKTVVYTCINEIPYFDTLATYACLYPVSGSLLEQIGVEGLRAVDFDTLWYSGPYLVDTFVHMNEKVLVPNPNYWNQDCKRFDSITIKMVESQDQAFQLFQTGEIDRITLTEANLQAISRNESSEFYDKLTETRPSVTSMQIHFCFDKNLESGDKDDNWNTAVRNKNFRLSWYYGLDLTNALSRLNAINPISCANYTYSSPNLVRTSDGKDYQTLVLEKIGITPSDEKFMRYDTDKAADYKAKAIEELTAAGVTFPVQCDLYVKSGNQSAIDTALVFQQMFSDYLGDDYVKLEVKEYITSETTEVREPSLASIYFTGWSPDYGDPISNLAQEVYKEDNAFFSQSVSKIDNVPEDSELVQAYKEYTDMVWNANSIVDDNDARYEAFADAEAFLLNNAFTIPYYVNVSWQLSCLNVYSRVYSPYGIQVNRMVNWETNSDIYSTEEYAAIKDAFFQNK
ncbi:MAG: ABC transporter substrate-binding protein [Eubacteriales bacterium]|nr:ABC transporter substrate-binding protein [Eubacteriales bacterium]